MAKEEREQLKLIQARQEARREGERVRRESKLMTWPISTFILCVSMLVGKERADFEADVLRKQSLALQQKEDMEKFRAVSIAA